MDKFKREIEELAGLLTGLAGSDFFAKAAEASHVITESLKTGGKVLACGNGGSAAIAQHLVAEMMVRFGKQRKPLPAISLCVDPSVVTACANDMGYENVFARQIEALARKGDAFVAMTTSGRSANIARALVAAKERGMKVIYLCGDEASPLGADVIISVPSRSVPRIQEIHTLIIHLIAGAVEEAFGK